MTSFENCTLLGYYAASSDNFLTTFRDSLSAPSSWGSLKMRPIACPETSSRNYNFSLHNNPEERSSHLLRGGSLKSRFDAVCFNINKKKSARAENFFQRSLCCIFSADFDKCYKFPVETSTGMTLLMIIFRYHVSKTGIC